MHGWSLDGLERKNDDGTAPKFTLDEPKTFIPSSQNKADKSLPSSNTEQFIGFKA
jgi:hypothetical protein